MPGGGGPRRTAADIVAERQARQQNQQTQTAQRNNAGESSVDGTLRSFRPPAGFLDATMRGEDVVVNDDEGLDIDAMLSQLKSGSGARVTRPAAAYHCHGRWTPCVFHTS